VKQVTIVEAKASVSSRANAVNSLEATSTWDLKQ